MAELKTQENDGSVEQFLHQVPQERKRQDAFQLLQLMQEVTGETRVCQLPSGQAYLDALAVNFGIHLNAPYDALKPVNCQD